MGWNQALLGPRSKKGYGTRPIYLLEPNYFSWVGTYGQLENLASIYVPTFNYCKFGPFAIGKLAHLLVRLDIGMICQFSEL